MKIITKEELKEEFDNNWSLNCCDVTKVSIAEYFIEKGRQSKLKDELIILTSILNTNDKYRIGEIEKRIEEIKKELAGGEK